MAADGLTPLEATIVAENTPGAAGTPVSSPVSPFNTSPFGKVPAVTATALHVGTLVADNYVHFGPRQILVPLASSWKSGAVTWGVFGLYLLIAVQVTSMLMKRLPKRLWRAVHSGSYALVWVATIHAGTAGSDTTNRVYQGFALLLTIVAVTAAVLRITVGRRGARAGASSPTA